MEIRKATNADLDAVEAVYSAQHTAEEAGESTVGWIRDVYPTRATAQAALDRDDLFVLCEDGAVRGTAIINQIQVDVYAGAPWQYRAPDEAVCVLHTLVIDPAAKGRGLGRAFVAFYEDYARAHGCPALRMDTNARNTAARTFYKGLGYREIAVVPTNFNGIPGVNLVLLEKSVKGTGPLTTFLPEQEVQP